MIRTAASMVCFVGLLGYFSQLAPAVHAQPASASPQQAIGLHTDPRPHGQYGNASQTVVVRQPQVQFDSNGELMLLPQVEFYESSNSAGAQTWSADSPVVSARQVSQPESQGLLPPPASEPPAELITPPVPIFDQVIAESCQQCQSCPGGETHTVEHWWQWLMHTGCTSGSNDRGVGVERVMNAPFEVYTTQPENNYRFRLDAAYGLEFPDRSEYFWGRTVTGRGPRLPEQSVKYQDFRLLLEIGGPKFSTQTEIPIRVVDPLVNANHAGLGDMSITTKTLLLDGDRWQITQIFKTHINTGAVSSGLGTGHVSLEPGFAYRYRCNDWFYLHGDTTYWFALGGHPTHSGQVLRSTFAMSGVLYENDVAALIPTLEFLTWTALNGQKTSAAGIPLEVDGEGILNIQPGLRYVWDTGGDFGLLELGLSGAVSVTGNHWYDSLMRFDVRWAY